MRVVRFVFLVIGGLLGGLGRALFQALTGRNLAQEQADEAQEQARQAAAEETQARAEADRDEARTRHEEAASLAEQQIAETRALREALAHQARRRQEIAALSRSHDVEVRSAEWDIGDPEPEHGAPTRSFA